LPGLAADYSIVRTCMTVAARGRDMPQDGGARRTADAASRRSGCSGLSRHSSSASRSMKIRRNPRPKPTAASARRASPSTRATHGDTTVSRHLPARSKSDPSPRSRRRRCISRPDGKKKLFLRCFCAALASLWVRGPKARCRAASSKSTCTRCYSLWASSRYWHPRVLCNDPRIYNRVLK